MLFFFYLIHPFLDRNEKSTIHCSFLYILNDSHTYFKYNNIDKSLQSQFKTSTIFFVYNCKRVYNSKKLYIHVVIWCMGKLEKLTLVFSHVSCWRIVHIRCHNDDKNTLLYIESGSFFFFLIKYKTLYCYFYSLFFYLHWKINTKYFKLFLKLHSF